MMLIQSRAGHILLINHHTSKSLVLPFPYGVLMNAAYFNVFTKQPERSVQLRWQGSVTIHLAPADKFPGWCYLQMWSNVDQQYKCTCYDAKKMNYCQHISELEKQESILA